MEVALTQSRCLPPMWFSYLPPRPIRILPQHVALLERREAYEIAKMRGKRTLPDGFRTPHSCSRGLTLKQRPVSRRTSDHGIS